MSNKKKYSIHHEIPTSRSGTNHPDNKISLPDNEHVNLHRWLGNKTPVEQLFKVLTTNKKVWSDKFVHEIIKVLDANFDNYYKEHVHGEIQGERGSLMELERLFSF